MRMWSVRFPCRWSPVCVVGRAPTTQNRFLLLAPPRVWVWASTQLGNSSAEHVCTPPFAFTGVRIRSLLSTPCGLSAAGLATQRTGAGRGAWRGKDSSGQSGVMMVLTDALDRDGVGVA